MIKLTSDLDFKLAKKRFGMMRKKHSRKRTTRTALLLLPVLVTSVFMFCTELKKDDITEIDANPALRISYDDGRYADIPLAFSRNDSRTNRYYSSNGKPFTGTQSIYLTRNDQLDKIIEFENGLKTTEISFDDDGSELQKIERKYENGTLISKSTRIRGVLSSESEYYSDSLVSKRQYYDDGTLKFEGVGTIKSNGILVFDIQSQRYAKDGSPYDRNFSMSTALPENVNTLQQANAYLEEQHKNATQKYIELTSEYLEKGKQHVSQEDLSKLYDQLFMLNIIINNLSKDLDNEKLKPAPPLPPEPEKLLANNQD